MEGILQCLNTALWPSKTEITVYKEWNVTWNSLDERILIIVPTARALESITDQSKISSGVHLNMEVSITQKHKYGYDIFREFQYSSISIPCTFQPIL